MNTACHGGGHAGPQLNMMAAWGNVGLLAAQQGMGALTLPFDAAREQYARSVVVGLLPRSMLASRDFELALATLEQLTLGPLARHV
jgi:predicted CxxxxCH...CXXCH cytochrome family protein